MRNLAKACSANISSHFKHYREEAQAILSNQQAIIGNFQTDFDQSFLNGKIAAIISESSGEHLKSVLEADKPFYVDIAWELQGQLASMVSGKWSVKLFFESMGGLSNNDFAIPRDEFLVDLKPCGDGYYKDRIVIPANTVIVEHGGSPYQVTAILTYYKPAKSSGKVMIKIKQLSC